MKKIQILITILALTFIAFGQDKKTDKPNFDIEDFNKKFETVEWLVRYDWVAWQTSDAVMEQDQKELAKLGREWFCFQDNEGVWHAVYGKYEAEKYSAVFHFKVDNESKIIKTDDKIDAEFLNSHAKALNTANQKMSESLKDENVPRFNQYIRQNQDKTFSVWLLPAFQTNGVAVYGAEFIYTLDKTGSKIIKEEKHIQENFRGFKSSPPREIWLNYEELEKPSLGGIFFVWYYKPYFTRINLETAKSISTIVKDDEKGYFWVHVEKENKSADKTK